MLEKFYILIIVMFFYSVISLVLITIKMIKEYKLKIAEVQKEIDNLKRLRDAGGYLLEVIPDDDDWVPDGNFVKKCVEECKKRNINVTEEEIWDYFQPCE